MKQDKPTNTFSYENNDYKIEHGLLYERRDVDDMRCWVYKPIDAVDTNQLYLRAAAHGWTHNIEDTIERFHAQGHGARKNGGWRT